MPWVELIEGAVREADPAELRLSLGDDAAEFARLVPELRRLIPGIPAPLDLPPEQQRRYTFNSIREYVTRASRNQPRLYVLEDLHWADEPTLLLLEHLAERLAEIPCLVVGTYRDSPSDITPQLAATLSRAVRSRHGHLVALASHSEDEVGALLQALTSQRPPETVAAAIYEETDGNAFFVEEVFRHLVESGRLLDGKGRFRTDVAIGDLDVPANVRLVIDRRHPGYSPVRAAAHVRASKP
jgi:predicted ATPase